MICTRAWVFRRSTAEHCPVCGARLIPYIPTCRVCSSPSPRAMQVEEIQERSLEKPADALRIGHLSDLHVGQLEGPSVGLLHWFQIWLERFANHDVDVIVVSGDLVHKPADEPGLLAVRAALEDCGIPFVVVPGNHDTARPGRSEIFHDIYGRYPRVETFGGVDFVLFDSMAGLPMEERNVAERLYGDVICYTEGRIGPEQLEVASELLQGSTSSLRVAVLHHHLARQHPDPMIEGVPLLSPILDEDLFDTMKVLHDTEQFFRWTTTHEVAIVFHGHKHLFQQPGIRTGGLLVLNGGTSTLRPRKLARLVDLQPPEHICVLNVELRH